MFKEQPKVGIVILNYMTCDLTINCLQDLNSISYKNYFVIVIDNASPNDSYEVIKSFIQTNNFNYEVEIILNEKNGGYSYGNNVGARRANELGANYILVMNNDIEIIDRDIIENIIGYMYNSEEVILAYPAIIRKDGLPELPAYQKRVKGLKKVYINLLYPLVILLNKMKRSKQHHKPMIVYSVSGCFFIIDSSTFKEIGYFDENIFLYGEEIILGEKLYRLGKKAAYLPDCKVLHNHSVTTKSIYKSKEIAIMQYSNLKYYFESYRPDVSKYTYNLVKISELVKIHFYLPMILGIRRWIKFLKKHN